jgi:YggT family protein
MPGFVLQQVVVAVATILDSVLWLYFWIVIGAVVVSWVNADPRNPIVRFLYAVTEPVLYQIRRTLPFVCAGGLDFSPLILIFAIQAAKIVIVRSLYELALRMAMLGLPGGPGLG